MAEHSRTQRNGSRRETSVYCDQEPIARFDLRPSDDELCGSRRNLRCRVAPAALPSAGHHRYVEPLRPEVAIQRAVLNRFAHMLRFDRLFSFKVGERAAHFQNSIVGSSR
jgi:hypothetical protein